MQKLKHFVISDKHIERGSVTITDCWKGYDGIEQDGFEHLCVDHTHNFIDPETWANTQKIESSWRLLRKALNKGSTRNDLLADHMCEFLWRRWKRLQQNDPLEGYWKT